MASAMPILGFLGVAFSEFASLQQFAALSAFSIVVVGLTGLALLPALLVRRRLQPDSIGFGPPPVWVTSNG